MTSEKRRFVTASMIACAALWGCSSSKEVGRDAGPGDAGVGGIGSGSSKPGADSCLEAAKPVYLVTSNRELLRFEPEAAGNGLTKLGMIDCPSNGATPFSMAVDRNAIAWVLYTGGALFRVTIASLACERTNLVIGQAGFVEFGMGFATDQQGGSAETLFIGGGTGGAEPRLGRLNLQNLQITAIGNLSGAPEMSGTGAGELWGFFPDTNPAKVAKIDKSNATLSRSFSLSTLGVVNPQRWAFAFWGGRFHIFLQQFGQPSSRIYRLNPDDGTLSQVDDNTGYGIVGAGVSTCAPVTSRLL